MSVRTLRYWLATEWWVEVESAAVAHETEEIVTLALQALRDALPDDGKLALRVLERLDARFAPATQRHAVEVEGFVVDLVPPPILVS